MISKICLLAIVLAMMGCAAAYSAKTEATYEVAPDGTKKIVYSSSKEQQGLDLDLTEVDGKPTGVKIHVVKSSTSEQAIAAAAAQTKAIVDGIMKAFDLGLAAGKAAGS